jgi:predicted nucleic acid-binding protein
MIERFVVDASVAIAWFFPEEERERAFASAVLDLVGDQARR